MVVFGIDLVLLIPALMISATPVLLAAIGEAIVEKSGVLNLGVEGMMIIGAVIGFIIALSAVDPNTAADAENVASVIATLIDGMSVALNTTLVGATLYLWLTVNYRVLTSGTVSLIAEAVYTGERRASA